MASNDAVPNALATNLAANSFALLTLPVHVQHHLEMLSAAAAPFFERTTANTAATAEAIRDFRTLVPSSHGGTVLYGFTQPTQAKVLFRYRRGAPGMRWPSDEFRDAVESCERVIRTFVAGHFDALVQTSFSSSPLLCFEDLARDDLEEVEDAAEASCPFDLFFYLPRDDASADCACEAHVDRGLVHFIASDAPGLEVIDASTLEWGDAGIGVASNCGVLAPDVSQRDSSGHPYKRQRKDIAGLRDPSSPGLHLSNPGVEAGRTFNGVITPNSCWSRGVILCNGALQTLSAGGFPACVHRVVVPRLAHRLSVSFELRLRSLESAEATARLAARFGAFRGPSV